MGHCAEISICHFGTCLTKNLNFGTPKMENVLFVDETKISLCGIPHHPKGHARVQYGLILIDYAMIRAEHSSFDLKVMKPQTL
jgi:hypothetical protein